jgi:hypothetical protein
MALAFYLIEKLSLRVGIKKKVIYYMPLNTNSYIAFPYQYYILFSRTRSSLSYLCIKIERAVQLQKGHPTPWTIVTDGLH